MLDNLDCPFRDKKANGGPFKEEHSVTVCARPTERMQFPARGLGNPKWKFGGSMRRKDGRI